MTFSKFRVIVVGMGVQGKKRFSVAKDELVATIDINKNKKNVTFHDVDDINDNQYDAVLLCTPDEVKFDLIKRFLLKKKHVLVEKPLYATSSDQIRQLQETAIKNNVVLYTAYNHRFEPHIINMKKIITKKELGELYRIRMFYGNGTSGLVKSSQWRDRGNGVILDIGSHLLDTLIYWFGDKNLNFEISHSFCFENLSPDHAIISGYADNIFVELEVSLVSWKNDFVCDVIGKKGSAHIYSLCKWGPSKLIKRSRILPAGLPKEKSKVLIKPDPTWKEEYKFFKKLIKSNVATDLSRDISIFNVLNNCI